MKVIGWKASSLHDRCPGCMGKNIKVMNVERLIGANKFMIEHLVCNDCHLKFERQYRYAGTVWSNEEEDT